MKPWKIALAAMGGIAVIGGIAAGIGITIAHNHRMENALESMSARVEELLEQATETSEEAETTTAESTTASNSDTQAPAKAPETVVVYVEPSTQPPITWTYDPVLSRELGKLIEAKFPGYKYDLSLFRERGPGNFIRDGIIKKFNEGSLYIGQIASGNDIAQKLLDAWTQIDIKELAYRDTFSFCIAVYKYSNGCYFISVC